MLFCILLLTTTPTFSSFCDIRAMAGLSCPSCLSCPFLSQHGFHPRQVSTYRPELVGRLELPHRFLDPHAKQLIDQLALLHTELVGAEIPKFGRFHSIFSCAKRVANLVR